MTRRLRLYVLTITVLFSSFIHANVRITGKVTSRENEAVIGAVVRAYNAKKKIIAFASTDDNGNYSIQVATDSIPAELTFACMGFETKSVSPSNNQNQQHINITLQEKPFELDEVLVKIPPIHNIGDTIVYNVGAFASKADRTIEDVLKRLPGIEVKSNGQIHYNGEAINKFYIEGLDILGGKYAIATRNISPDDIESVNVYENHQPKKALKSLKISSKAGLNLKLKKGKSIKPIGHIKGGIGYGDEVNWLAELFALKATKTRQSIASAKGNNTGVRYSSETGSFSAPTSYGFVPTSIFSTMPFGTANIPSSRYFYNKSAYASYNSIHKLKSEKTINANADYAYETRRYSNSTITTYWSNEPIIIEENATTRLSSHGAKLNLKLEKNSDKVYLSNTLRASGNFADNQHELIQNLSISQAQRTNNVSVRNNLNIIINTGKKAFELSSLISFANTPLNYIHATNTDDRGDIITHQSATGKSFYTIESTGFSWNLSQSTHIGTSIDFEAAYNTFLSENTQQQINDLSGYKINTPATPYMQYTTRSVTWRTEAQVTMQDIKYGSHSIHKPFVGHSSKITYRITPRVRAIFDIGRRYTTGNISDFIESPIYTTYRQTTVLGSGQLGIQHSDYISADAFYRNTFQGTFGTLKASYSRITNNVLTASDASSNASSQSKETAKNHGNSIVINGLFSKFFRDIHTTVKGIGSVMIMSREMRKQGILMNINSGVYTINGNVESDLFHDAVLMKAGVMYAYSRQNSSIAKTPVSTNDINLSFGISYFPIKALEIYGKSSHGWQNSQNSSKSHHTFVDCGLRLTHKKMEWELAINNITNQRTYEYTVIRSIDCITRSFALRPFEAMVSAKYKF